MAFLKDQVDLNGLEEFFDKYFDLDKFTVQNPHAFKLWLLNLIVNLEKKM